MNSAHSWHVREHRFAADWECSLLLPRSPFERSRAAAGAFACYTVGSETLKPSFSNSPWMRGAPQVGFSAAIRKISSGTSLLTGLRPTTRLVLERYFQYSRKPARCHATTVRGVTRISGFCHPDHTFFKRTQNSLWRADNRPCGRLLCSASNCWRRARFSRTRSWREPNALKIQPTRCRSDENMAEILPEQSWTGGVATC